MMESKLQRWKQVLRSGSRKLGFGLNENDRRVLRLRNRYRGRRAFVIGNGPSLNRIDLALLRDEITIGCNGLFLIFDKMGFKPTIYTVEDRLVAEDRASIINSIKGTTKIFPADLKYCLEQDHETIFVNFLRQYDSFPRFTDRFAETVYWGGTVTYLSLQIAYYIGIREVYLVGMDHDYKPPARADEQEGAVIKSHSADVNHFHPGYFGPGFRYHDPRVDRMETGYQKAKEFFERNGGAIYNATPGGKLELFERVDFSAMFR